MGKHLCVAFTNRLNGYSSLSQIRMASEIREPFRFEGFVFTFVTFCVGIAILISRLVPENLAVSRPNTYAVAQAAVAHATNACKSGRSLRHMGILPKSLAHGNITTMGQYVVNVPKSTLVMQ